jgi:hypothetical protein
LVILPLPSATTGLAEKCSNHYSIIKIDISGKYSYNIKL